MSIKIIDIIVFSVITFIVCFFSCRYLNFRAKNYDLKRKDEDKGDVDEGSNSLANDRFFIKTRAAVICSCIFCIISVIIGLVVYDRATSVINLWRVFFVCISSFSVSIIDFKLKIIPNLFIVIFLGIGMVFHIIDLIFAAIAGDVTEKAKTILLFNLLACVVITVVLVVLSLLTHGGMGFGDIKYLASLCFLGGISLLAFSLLFSLIYSMLIGLFLMLIKKKKLKDEIPFGPFMMMGVITCCIMGLM